MPQDVKRSGAKTAECVRVRAERVKTPAAENRYASSNECSNYGAVLPLNARSASAIEL